MEHNIFENMESLSYRKCYELGLKTLSESEIPDASLDARLLLEHVCQTNRHDLLVHGEQEVEAEKLEQYLSYIEQRSHRVPLQYITGQQEFMGLSFKVDHNVLIPRQDTEILVEEVLRILQDGNSILDMCTGSGCILVSLLHFSNNCKGLGVDISEEAIAIARENADVILRESAENIQNVERSYSFVKSDLFQEVIGTYDIIVSNPPYIKSDVITTLMPEVKEFEPYQALDGKEDGLYFYKKIITESKKYLNKEGSLFFEIGYDQAIEVQSLMKEAGFVNINVIKDYAGLDRVVYGNYMIPGGKIPFEPNIVVLRQCKKGIE